jgi:hypothetical protein
MAGDSVHTSQVKVFRQFVIEMRPLRNKFDRPSTYLPRGRSKARRVRAECFIGAWRRKPAMPRFLSKPKFRHAELGSAFMAQRSSDARQMLSMNPDTSSR